MAYAIKGCIIVGEEGDRVTYIAKCDRCGWVDEGLKATQTVRPGSTTNGIVNWNCRECRSHIDIKLKGRPQPGLQDQIATLVTPTSTSETSRQPVGCRVYLAMAAVAIAGLGLVALNDGEEWLAPNPTNSVSVIEAEDSDQEADQQLPAADIEEKVAARPGSVGDSEPEAALENPSTAVPEHNRPAPVLQAILTALETGMPTRWENGGFRQTVSVSEPVQLTGSTCRTVQMGDVTELWCKADGSTWEPRP